MKYREYEFLVLLHGMDHSWQTIRVDLPTHAVHHFAAGLTAQSQ